MDDSNIMNTGIKRTVRRNTYIYIPYISYMYSMVI